MIRFSTPHLLQGCEEVQQSSLSVGLHVHAASAESLPEPVSGSQSQRKPETAVSHIRRQTRRHKRHGRAVLLIVLVARLSDVHAGEQLYNGIRGRRNGTDCRSGSPIRRTWRSRRM